MVQYIQAKGVASSIAFILLLAFFGITLPAAVPHAKVAYIPFIMPLATYLFFNMSFEDFKYRTVDLRKCAILFVILAAVSNKTFYIYFAFSLVLLIEQLFFLLVIKWISKIVAFNFTDKNSPENINSSIPFIPFFILALFILFAYITAAYFIAGDNSLVLLAINFEALISDIFAEIWIYSIPVCLILLFLLFIYTYKNKITLDDENIFGLGDVFFLAAAIPFFGVIYTIIGITLVGVLGVLNKRLGGIICVR